MDNRLTAAEQVAADAYAVAITTATSAQLDSYLDHHAAALLDEDVTTGQKDVHRALIAVVQREREARQMAEAKARLAELVAEVKQAADEVRRLDDEIDTCPASDLDRVDRAYRVAVTVHGAKVRLLGDYRRRLAGAGFSFPGSRV